jgi:hypothetical protein
MRPILILACLAGLTVIAGHALAPAAPEQGAETGLVVVVDASGAVRATGRVPREFPVRHLKKRIPGIDLSGGVTSAGNGDPEAWERALDALNRRNPPARFQHRGDARRDPAGAWLRLGGGDCARRSPATGGDRVGENR